MTAAAETSKPNVHSVINKLATEMRKGLIPPGDVAALRRGQDGPAFWKIATYELEPAELLHSKDDHQRWVVILSGMARTVGLHQPGRRLGVVLAAAGVAEARVLRLTRAHGEALHDVVRGVVQQLANTGHTFDWADVANLILSDGAPWEDTVRRRIALDYYRNLDRS